MATLTPLVPNAGTLGAATIFRYTRSSANNWTESTTNATFADIDDAVGSIVNGDTGVGPTDDHNSTVTSNAIDLTAVNSDFNDMVTIALHYDAERSGGTLGDDTLRLEVRITNDGGGTAYVNWTTLHFWNGSAWDANGAPAANITKSLTLTAAGLAASKADWDNAELYFRWTHSKVKGPDSTAPIILVDCELTGTYNTGGPTTYDETGKTFTITSTTSVTDVHKRPVEIKFESMADPSDDTNHSLVLVMKYETGDTGTVDVVLLQGGTTIQSWTGQALTTSFAEYTFTVSEANAANITDYSDLRFRVTGSDAGDLEPSISHAYFELPELAAVDETGKSFTITSTTSGTDAATRAESLSATATATVSAADSVVRAEGGLAFTATATISETDTQVYALDALSFTVTATVTATDIPIKDETGLSLTATATVSVTDAAVRAESLAETITSTTTVVDALSYALDSLAFTATSSTSGTDTAVRSEGGQSFTIVSTVTATDAPSFVEAGLAFTVNSTLTGTDDVLFVESQSFTATATLSGADSRLLTESQSMTANVTVTVTDDLIPGGGTTYEEGGKTFTITSTVSGTDALVYPETLSFTATASVSLSDAAVRLETQAFTINATISEADTAQIAENASETIVSTTASTDAAVRSELSLAFTSSASFTLNDLQSGAEALSFTIGSTIDLTDVQTSTIALNFIIASFANVNDFVTTPDPGGVVDRVGRGTEHRVFGENTPDEHIARVRPRVRA